MLVFCAKFIFITKVRIFWVNHRFPSIKRAKSAITLGISNPRETSICKTARDQQTNQGQYCVLNGCNIPIIISHNVSSTWSHSNTDQPSRTVFCNWPWDNLLIQGSMLALEFPILFPHSIPPILCKIYDWYWKFPDMPMLLTFGFYLHHRELCTLFLCIILHIIPTYKIITCMRKIPGSATTTKFWLTYHECSHTVLTTDVMNL